MPELPCHQHNLAPVMTLVSDEVGQHVSHVKRQIAPHIRGCGWNLPTALEPEVQQAGNSTAADLQGANQLGAGHPAAVYRRRHLQAVWPSQSLDPHAACVVDMASNHLDGSHRRTWNRSGPRGIWELLDQGDGDAVVRGPGVQNARTQR